MFNQSQNKRVKDSMERLSLALFDLMKTYSYAEINIRQLCAAAGVTRRTFYRNFETKDDIIDYIIYSRLYYSWDYEKAQSFEETILSFYRFWATRKNDLQIFEQQHIFYILTDKIAKYFEMNSVLASLITEQDDIMTFGAYFWASFLASMIKTLEVWSSRDFKETPEQLTRMTINGFRCFKNV
jgi:AcrR family transcriptional regulator